jgi:hypothetical protein
MSYKKYPYQHYHLGSVPKITTKIIDKQIDSLLDLINKYPTITVDQLKVIQDKVKQKIIDKENKYLVPSSKVSSSKKTRKSVSFSKETKLGGKKNKNKTRRH